MRDVVPVCGDFLEHKGFEGIPEKFRFLLDTASVLQMIHDADIKKIKLAGRDGFSFFCLAPGFDVFGDQGVLS
jgi:hypothetical protein